MNQAKVMGILRHTLTFLGGVLITQGVIDESLFTELFGAIMTLVGGVWSVVDKKTVEAVEEAVEDVKEKVEEVKAKVTRRRKK
jgi:uncharacterized protein YbjQ (UPF0145 family)